MHNFRFKHIRQGFERYGLESEADRLNVELAEKLGYRDTEAMEEKFVAQKYFFAKRGEGVWQLLLIHPGGAISLDLLARHKLSFKGEFKPGERVVRTWRSFFGKERTEDVSIAALLIDPSEKQPFRYFVGNGKKAVVASEEELTRKK